MAVDIGNRRFQPGAWVDAEKKHPRRQIMKVGDLD
jgi:hypothetical protein